MKNQVKKTLAGLAVLSVLVSGASVFAAQTVTDSGYWRQSFDDLAAYNVPDDMYISVNSENLTAADLEGLAAEGVFIGGKSGAAGNAAGYFAAENLNSAVTVGAIDGTDDTSMKKASGLAATAGGITSAQMHIAFEAMAADFDAERGVLIDTRYKAGQSTNLIRLLTFQAGNTIKIGSTTLEYVMPKGKWVHFDLYAPVAKDSKSSVLKLYADGKYIGEGTVKSGSGTKTRGVISVEAVKLSLAANEKGFYLDNLTVDKKAEPDADFALVSEKAVIDDENMAITVPAGTIAADFSGAAVTIVTESGAVQEAAAQDGYVIAQDAYTGGSIYYTLTVEGGTVDPDPEEQVTLTTGFDSGYYAEAADAEEKQGVIGFQTRVEKAGAEEIARYGTFLLRSGDFDGTAEQTEIANEADIESGKSFVVEVGNIGAGDFAEIVYAKSFVETVKGNFFYGAVAHTTVDAGNKWLGAVSTAE